MSFHPSLSWQQPGCDLNGARDTSASSGTREESRTSIHGKGKDTMQGTVMTENELLRAALAKCLNIIHDYYGLTDKEMAAAINDAATNPEWHPRDSDRWGVAALVCREQ